MGLSAGDRQVLIQQLNEEIIISSFACVNFLFLQPYLYQKHWPAHTSSEMTNLAFIMEAAAAATKKICNNKVLDKV